MIKIKIVGQNLTFQSLEVKGHANSGPYGQDLMCAAISAVITGGFNAIIDPTNFEMKLDEGYALLKAKGPISEKDNIVIHTIICSLKTIALENEAFVKIKNI